MANDAYLFVSTSVIFGILGMGEMMQGNLCMLERWSLVLLVAMWGCGDDTTETSTTEIPIPDAEEIIYTIEESGAGLLSMDPLLFHNAWVYTMQTYADATCPVMQIHNGMDLWNESCTTQAGNEFLGWALNFRGRNIPNEVSTWEQVEWVSGQAQIKTVDGILLQDFGDILYQHGKDADNNDVVMGFTYGDFAWTAEEAGRSWLQSNISMEYYYQFTTIDTEGGEPTKRADIQAWVSFFDNSARASIWQDIVIDQRECAREPIEGEIWTRSTDGVWIQVLFDAEYDCDGCGYAWHDGEYIDEVCVDISAWLDWQEYPWE